MAGSSKGAKRPLKVRFDFRLCAFLSPLLFVPRILIVECLRGIGRDLNEMTVLPDYSAGTVATTRIVTLHILTSQ